MALPADYSIDQNDLYPPLIITAKDGNKNPIDFTAATSVAFHMQINDGSSPVIQGTASFVTPRTSGQLQYDWNTGDTTKAGRYNGEFEVMWGTKPMTVPNTKIKIQIDINPEIA